MMTLLEGKPKLKIRGPGTYVLRCQTEAETLKYEVQAQNSIEAFLKAGKILLRLRRAGLCKHYEFLDPNGHGCPEFYEIMENGDATEQKEAPPPVKSP